MGLQKLLSLPLLMLLLHTLSCYSNLEEHPIPSCPNEAASYGQRAYPSYYGDESASAYDPITMVIAESFDEASNAESPMRVVNVADYGAKADGTDDGEAFEKAWNAACSASASAVLSVPKGKTYLLKPITFSDPCKSNVSVMIMGTIEASMDRSDWNENDRKHWILFDSITNLAVGGGGTINGNGEIWWKNSCKIDKSLPCSDAPTAMTFYSCNYLRVENLMIKDSQQIHLSFEKSKNVKASNLTITAPVTSPNTDGIHVTRTQYIQITNCTIKTGDDCISIVTGSQNVEARNIDCGPGHGISIGSLGSHNSVAHVSGVKVDTAELHGTTNGVRIKTWQGGSGYATGIVFQNIAMYEVKNPILIDQNYCDSSKPCQEQESAVKVSDVTYKNITGTSASEVAIRFSCSESVPCSGITLQDIDLVRGGGKAAESSCKNVNWKKMGTVIPPPCA